MEREPRYPGGDPDVFRISYSSLVWFQRCGVRYQFDRTIKHRKGSMVMVRGIALAEVARADNISKMERGKGIGLQEATGIGIAAYEERLEQYELPEKRAELIQGRDDMRGIVRAYVRQISPVTKNVIAAERAITVKLGDMEIVGRPDVFTAAGVGDYKTGKEWQQEQVDRSRQLTTYGFLYRELTGELPKQVWIDTIFKADKRWIAKRVLSHRTDDDYRALWNVIVRAREAIEQEIFVPAAEGTWWCAPAHCPHFMICPCVRGRRT